MAARTWCPAIDADESSLAVTVAAMPKTRRAASPSRDASHAAANVSVSASLKAAHVVVHNTKVQQFDGRVALSEASRRRMTTNPHDVDVLTNVLRASCREPVPSHVVEARSLKAAVDAAEQTAARRPDHKSTISFVDAAVTTSEVQQLIDDANACAVIDGLSLRGAVRGSNTLQVLFEALNRDPEVYRKFVLAKEAAEAARLARENQPANEEDEQPLEEDPADADLGPEPLPPVDLRIASLAVANAPSALSENTVAAEEIAKFVSNSKELKQLELDNCNLQSAATLQALCTAVLNTRSLTELNLSKNGVGRDEEAAASVEAISKLLQESKFLLDVSLRDNEFSAGHCKLIAEALANSDTRVATPEPDPEPEAEPYTDDLGELEEAPQVKVGFPEDEKPPVDETAPEGEAEAKAEDGDESPPPPPAEEKDGAGEGENEEEEEEPPAPAAETPAAAAEEDDDDEEKAEERQRLLEEKEAAERAAREEAEAAWRERMETFIWGPERLHFEYSEYTARRAVMQLHVSETTALKEVEKAERASAKARQLTRQKLDRERRSGWSHLRALDLSGNPIGSEGAIALATMLRHRIPLAVLHDESKGEGEEVDETAEVPAKEDVADGDDADADGQDEAEDAEKPEGDESAAPAAAPPPAAVVKVPEPQFKLGMRTLKYLNLGQCGIAAKGLVALANIVKDNADELQVLLLSKNKFALKHRVVQAIDESREASSEHDEVDPDKPPVTRREVITDWASPAVASLRDCLAVNQTLKVLDLSFNHLYPTSIVALAQGLARNATLVTLRLDGNPIAHAGADGLVDTSGFETLLGAIATTRLANLGLAHTHLGPWLIQHGSAATLAKTLFSLTTLDIGRNELNAASLHVINEAAAAAEHCMLTTLLLSANNFERSDEGVAGEISILLKKLSRRLVTVDLSDNPNIGDAALRSIAKDGLADMPALKRLNLRRTRAGNPTVVPLKKVIHDAMFLEDLDLGDSCFDVESAESLMQSICESTTLRRLSLWSRQVQLGYAVTAALVSKTPKSLLHVDVALPQALGVEDPADDSDESYLVEDLEAALLKNRQRASVPN